MTIKIDKPLIPPVEPVQRTDMDPKRRSPQEQPKSKEKSENSGKTFQEHLEEALRTNGKPEGDSGK